MKRESGVFITFEGIDGTGKTTQVARLAEALRAAGEIVVTTKEPGDHVPDQAGGYTVVGSNVGYGIRQLLFKDPTTHKMAPGVNDMLFLADHVQLQHEVIKPGLLAGSIVLCDRYMESQLAYSTVKGSPYWAMDAFHRATIIRPDITFFLIGDPSKLATRTKRVGTHEEGKQDGKVWGNIAGQIKVQEAYRSVLEVEQNITIEVIERVHERTIDQVAAEIKAVTQARLLMMSRHKTYPTAYEDVINHEGKEKPKEFSVKA